MSATHPRALFVLCLVELLERTAGVLVAALLILFLTEARGLSTSDATALAGSFLALTYFTPLIGGLLTDRYLSTRAAMQLGALLSLGGYAVVAFFPSTSPWLGLGLVALGQGFFDPASRRVSPASTFRLPSYATTATAFFISRSILAEPWVRSSVVP
jgi:POT family proton-dependent oligopeptide transporter